MDMILLPRVGATFHVYRHVRRGPVQLESIRSIGGTDPDMCACDDDILAPSLRCQDTRNGAHVVCQNQQCGSISPTRGPFWHS